MTQADIDLLDELQKEIDKVKYKSGKFEIRYSEFVKFLEATKGAIESVLKLRDSNKSLESELKQWKKDPVKSYQRIIYKNH
jgi:septation ring formation regulator EzrA